MLRCLTCRLGCGVLSSETVDWHAARWMAQGKIKETYTMKPKARPQVAQEQSPSRFFIVDNGTVRDLEPQEYSRAPLYETLGSYSVERRFVKPEDKADILYEGKKPPKQTVPVLISHNGHATVLASWSDLESNPESLMNVSEVRVARAVKQVFVLKPL
ncbi:hypothetical protein [Desulfosoma sp.]|uniref:hypothetical protein n=1 Tax=Desulfosoma sp. TaxID=2603217 RepID=UPI00404989D4